MPMKINVGLSKKVGEPNYSSRGGDVHFEVEVEATLVREPEKLRQRIEYLFRLAEQSLAEQLAPLSAHTAPGQDNGHVRPSPRLATARQVGLIQRLAEQVDASLEVLLHEVFDTDRCENLSVGEASQLINILQRHCQSPEDAEKPSA